MTDNEIIRALGCCMLSQCKGCTYVAEPLCHEQNCRDALDLITRQKAEIERLKAENKILSRYEGNIQAESIKEFAERLKEKQYCLCDDVVDVEDIDNLVKEMVGDVG